MRRMHLWMLVCAGGWCHEAAGAPTITVWYGPNQTFGLIGTPLPVVNVLGNAAGAARVTSLTCRLNGGPPQSLSLGPNSRRLAETGDFNVELAYADLRPGANDLAITAIDQQNATTTTMVTVNNASGAIRPLPCTIDWSQASEINSVAQILDGQWYLSGNTVRPSVMAYDRLIAIGDQSWADYEVTVPITVYAINPDGYAPPSNGPAVGVLLRWPGHAYDGSQPNQGIYPLGGIALFRWATQYDRFELFGNNGYILDADPTLEPLILGTAYLFKARVETVTNRTWYSFKWWKSGHAEPPEWHLSGSQSSDPGHGCLLLLAHHVDAAFGSVALSPLHGGSLQVFIDPTEAASAGAQWRRKGMNTWHDGGQIESGLAAGSYTVEFRPIADWNTPAEQVVSIHDGQRASIQATYLTRKGGLRVNISPPEVAQAGAQWRRVGTTPWGNSGDTEPDVLAGDYLVEFKRIDGWTEPAHLPVQVVAGQVVQADASYQLQTGQLQINITPTAANQAGAQWRRTGTTVWSNSGDTKPDVPVGDYTVEFKPLDRWSTPADLPVNVAAGQLAQADASYQLQTGQLQINIMPSTAAQTEARWRRVGTEPWIRSGEVESDLPAGDYRVEFSAVSGWLTPDPIAVEVQPGGLTQTSATYAAALGDIIVTLIPGQAVEDGACWRRQGADLWLDSGASDSKVPVGEHTLEFKPVTGWHVPPPQIVTVSANQTVAAQFTCARKVGSLTLRIQPEQAADAGARWRVDAGAWQPGGATAPELAVGMHTVSFAEVIGFNVPATISIEIADAETSEVTASYIAWAPPSAANLFIAVAYQTATPIQLLGQDPHGQALTFAISAPPVHGTLQDIDAVTGKVTYLPDAGYHGTDAFAFNADNGRQHATGQVRLIIAGPPDEGEPPIESFTLTVLTTLGADAPPPAVYVRGTSIQVSAPAPDTGYTFTRWTGDLHSADNPLTVVMDRDFTLTAEYAQEQVGSEPPPPAPPGLCGLNMLQAAWVVGTAFIALRRKV